MGPTTRLDDLFPLGSDVRIRFRVADVGAEDTVEGAVDEVTLYGYSLAVQGDVGGVTVTDRDNTRLDWNPVPGGSGASFNSTSPN